MSPPNFYKRGCQVFDNLFFFVLLFKKINVTLGFYFSATYCVLMNKIELRILGISYTHSQTSAYALILAEKDGLRRLPIIIGNFEAQSIAIELEKMKPSRPLTHDLFKAFAISFNIVVKEVVISKFEEGVFHAAITCTDGIKTDSIDARTSDAVALAIRFNAPIYTNEDVLNIAGIVLESDLTEDKSKSEPIVDEKSDNDDIYNDLSYFTLKELENMLKEAIENEEYEKASKIRDEIKIKKNKKK